MGAAALAAGAGGEALGAEGVLTQVKGSIGPLSEQLMGKEGSQDILGKINQALNPKMNSSLSISPDSKPDPMQQLGDVLGALGKSDFLKQNPQASAEQLGSQIAQSFTALVNDAQQTATKAFSPGSPLQNPLKPRPSPSAHSGGDKEEEKDKLDLHAASKKKDEAAKSALAQIGQRGFDAALDTFKTALSEFHLSGPATPMSGGKHTPASPLPKAAEPQQQTLTGSGMHAMQNLANQAVETFKSMFKPGMEQEQAGPTPKAASSMAPKPSML